MAWIVPTSPLFCLTVPTGTCRRRRELCSTIGSTKPTTSVWFRWHYRDLSDASRMLLTVIADFLPHAWTWRCNIKYSVNRWAFLRINDPAPTIMELESTRRRLYSWTRSAFDRAPNMSWPTTKSGGILGPSWSAHCVDVNNSRGNFLAAGWHETLNAETVGDGDDPALVTEANLLT